MQFRPAKISPVRKPSKLYSAFGVTGTIAEWSRDPRCLVPYHVLASRVKNGFVFEEALTLQVGCAWDRTRTTDRRIQKTIRTVTAFGETKTLEEWADDERCNVAYAGLYQRILRGLVGEDAIVGIPSEGDKLYTAFGETKSLSDWSMDPRCIVGFATLRLRAKRGEKMEYALTREKYEVVSTHLLFEKVPEK